MARPAGGNPELNAFVAEALQKRNTSYEELKSLLRDCRKRVEQEPDSEEAATQLVTLIGSITANVSSIHELKHESLVSDVLGIKLWNSAPVVIASVLDFTRNLVVANSAFTHTCLQLIVYSITPPPGSASPTDPSLDPHGPWRPSEQAMAVHQSLSAILSRVLALVPTAPTNLLPLIVAQMPHKLRDRNTQCLYLSALFRIAEDRTGAPIKEALLTAVVEHLLSLDVEIKWEDIVDVPTGEEEEPDDGANEDVFELEEMLASELDINAPPEELARRHAMLAMRQGAAGDGRGGWEGAVTGGHGAIGQQQQQQPARPPVDEMANKMDSMMELVFEHLEKRIAAGDLRQAWETLLSAFERTILNTHRSKFTQFLLFYACIHNPNQCSQSLIRLLLTRLRDSRQAPITRTACAAYLASFLARAAFVPDAMVVKALQDLASFCLDYCKSQAASLAGSSSAGNLAAAAAAATGGLADSAALMAMSTEAANAHTQRHQVFYAAVQAVLYVLCYHMQTLVGELQPQQQQPQQAEEQAGAQAGSSKERKQLADAVMALVRGPVWQLLNHRLQPLGACLPSVAAEFVHQAASLGVVDSTPLLTQVEPATRSQRPLEMFFPFDPYLLRRSSRFLQLKQSYVRWRHGHPQAAAAGAGAEAADSEDEEADEQDGRASAGSEGDEPEPSSEPDEDEDSEDEDMAGRSMPSDAMLHDPTHRLHAGGAVPLTQRARGVPHHGRPHGRGRGAGIAMGTSYMSYASTETASQGDGGASPYGMSPHDGGDMLVQNPLGSSPGVVPMSLGTPEMHFMSQVPLRIGRR